MQKNRVYLIAIITTIVILVGGFTFLTLFQYTHYETAGNNEHWYYHPDGYTVECEVRLYQIPGECWAIDENGNIVDTKTTMGNWMSNKWLGDPDFCKDQGGFWNSTTKGCYGLYEMCEKNGGIPKFLTKSKPFPDIEENKPIEYLMDCHYENTMDTYFTSDIDLDELECLQLYKDIREISRTDGMALAERETIDMHKSVVFEYVEKDCPDFPDLEFIYNNYKPNISVSRPPPDISTQCKPGLPIWTTNFYLDRELCKWKLIPEPKIQEAIVYVWNAHLQQRQIDFSPQERSYVNLDRGFAYGGENRVCSPLIAGNGTEFYISSTFNAEPFEMIDTVMSDSLPNDCHKIWKTDTLLVEPHPELEAWLENYWKNQNEN